ncbi:MAG: hypothetical protein Q9168_006643 [Polycauliona sp. 1 TL-2023]
MVSPPPPSAPPPPPDGPSDPPPPTIEPTHSSPPDQPNRSTAPSSQVPPPAASKRKTTASKRKTAAPKPETTPTRRSKRQRQQSPELIPDDTAAPKPKRQKTAAASSSTTTPATTRAKRPAPKKGKVQGLWDLDQLPILHGALPTPLPSPWTLQDENRFRQLNNLPPTTLTWTFESHIVWSRCKVIRDSFSISIAAGEPAQVLWEYGAFVRCVRCPGDEEYGLGWEQWLAPLGGGGANCVRPVVSDIWVTERGQVSWDDQISTLARVTRRGVPNALRPRRAAEFFSKVSEGEGGQKEYFFWWRHSKGVRVNGWRVVQPHTPGEEEGGPDVAIGPLPDFAIIQVEDVVLFFWKNQAALTYAPASMEEDKVRIREEKEEEEKKRREEEANATEEAARRAREAEEEEKRKEDEARAAEEGRKVQEAKDAEEKSRKEKAGREKLLERTEAKAAEEKKRKEKETKAAAEKKKKEQEAKDAAEKQRKDNEPKATEPKKSRQDILKASVDKFVLNTAPPKAAEEAKKKKPKTTAGAKKTKEPDADAFAAFLRDMQASGQDQQTQAPQTAPAMPTAQMMPQQPPPVMDEASQRDEWETIWKLGVGANEATRDRNSPLPALHIGDWADIDNESVVLSIATLWNALRDHDDNRRFAFNDSSQYSLVRLDFKTTTGQRELCMPAVHAGPTSSNDLLIPMLMSGTWRSPPNSAGFAPGKNPNKDKGKPEPTYKDDKKGDVGAIGHTVFAVAQRLGKDAEGCDQVRAIIMDSCPSASAENPQRIPDNVGKTIRRMGWLEGQDNMGGQIENRDHPPRVVEWQYPQVPHQVSPNSCGIHTILNAWRYMLGLPEVNSSVRLTGRRATASDENRFIDDALRMINLALRGYMDLRTIQAFFNHYGFCALQDPLSAAVAKSSGISATRMDAGILSDILEEQRTIATVRAPPPVPTANMFPEDDIDRVRQGSVNTPDILWSRAVHFLELAGGDVEQASWLKKNAGE